MHRRFVALIAFGKFGVTQAQQTNMSLFVTSTPIGKGADLGGLGIDSAIAGFLQKMAVETVQEYFGN